ncbi:MAG: hybrid sensor histidine kinase/response regulator [Anaerostipes sp.]|jgi:signal transduction histidine kinase/ActR/RegA family two-component response regulator|nr:ATP-binding protein [Anaerostipes sp.]
MDGSKKSKLTKKSRILIFLFALVMLIVSVAVFTATYRRLQTTISNERVEYVTELTHQIVEKVNATIQMHLQEATANATLMNKTQPKSFADIQSVFDIDSPDEITSEGQTLFVSAQGRCYLPNGETLRVADTGFLSTISTKRKATSSFSQVTSYGDYWLFGAPLDSISIDGIEMIAIIRAFPSESFSDNMTVAMFDSQTSSFLVSNTGTIMVKGHDATGYGSNLVYSLTAKGIDDKEAEKLFSAFQEAELTTNFIEIEDTQWIIQSEAVRDGYVQVVVLPLQITASETVASMNQLIFLVVVLLTLTLATILVVVIRLQRAAADRRLQQETFKSELATQSANNKSEFLAKMSHDIRTPLNGIIGMTYLAAQDMENQAELEEDLSKIQTSADYLLSLVNDILDMSKIESGKMELRPEPINVEHVLRDVSQQFMEEIARKKINLSLAGTESAPYSYLCDKLRIRQIMMNLISNAVKFTPTGGRIDLAMTIEAAGAGKDQITFSVADNGEGMSEEFLQRIFKPFEQATSNTAAEHGGSGLGLSIVKNLVRMMNGTITVVSELNVGSRFVVSIPMQQTEKLKDAEMPFRRTTSDDEAPTLSMPFAGHRVLLVEDHPINAQIASKVLSRWGLDVTVAENGKIGVDTFCASEIGFFSIIFMDIRMPVMDGYEAVQTIRSSGRDDAASIPIYAMSANAFDEDVEKSITAGMNGHLKKPLEINKLKQVLENCLLKEDGI